MQEIIVKIGSIPDSANGVCVKPNRTVSKLNGVKRQQGKFKALEKLREIGKTKRNENYI